MAIPEGAYQIIDTLAVRQKDFEIDITPEQAERWLTQFRYEHQRPINKRHVAFLASEMAKGRFSPHTMIKIAECGEEKFIIDGYHRLSAVMENKKPCHFFVKLIPFLNMEEIAKEYIRTDINRKRTLDEAVSIARLHEIIGVPAKYIRKASSAVKVLKSNFNTSGGSDPIVSNEDHIKDILTWKDEVATSYQLINKCARNTYASENTRRTMLAVLLYVLRYQKEKALMFFSNVYADDGLRQGTPEKALADYLKTFRSAGGTTIGGVTTAGDLTYVAYCWNRFYFGRNAKKTLPKDYVFYLEGTPMKRRV